MKKILLVLAVSGLLISCSAYDTKGKYSEGNSKVEVENLSFEGTNWSLVEYAADGTIKSVEENSNPSIVFTENEFAGNASVNRYFGRYITVGNDFKEIGQAGMTRKMGPEELMKQEGTFMKLLSEVTSYEVKGDHLLLLAGDRVVLTFKGTKVGY